MHWDGIVIPVAAVRSLGGPAAKALGGGPPNCRNQGSGPSNLWMTFRIYFSSPWRIVLICSWIILLSHPVMSKKFNSFPSCHSILITPLVQTDYFRSYDHKLFVKWLFRHFLSVLLRISVLFFCNMDRLRNLQIFKFWFCFALKFLLQFISLLSHFTTSNQEESSHSA